MLPVIAIVSSFLTIAYIIIYYNSLVWKLMSKHMGTFTLVTLLLFAICASIFSISHNPDVQALSVFLVAIAFYRYISSKQWRWLPLSFLIFLFFGIAITYIAIVSSEPFIQILCSILFFLLLLCVNHAKPTVLILVARGYYKEGQFDMAREIAYEATKTDEKYVKAHICFADACLGGGLIELAEMGYMKALSINRDCEDAHWGLGNCYKIRGMFDEALKEYGLAKREALRDYSHGFIDAIRNIHGAIVEWQAASAKGFAPAHNVLADAYFSLEMYDEAIVECQKAISIEPNDAHPHYVLGLAFSAQGDSEEATREFEMAERLNPNLKSIIPHRRMKE